MKKPNEKTEIQNEKTETQNEKVKKAWQDPEIIILDIQGGKYRDTYESNFYYNKNSSLV